MILPNLNPDNGDYAPTAAQIATLDTFLSDLLSKSTKSLMNCEIWAAVKAKYPFVYRDEDIAYSLDQIVQTQIAKNNPKP